MAISLSRLSILAAVVAGVYVMATRQSNHNASRAEIDATNTQSQAVKARQESQQKIELKIAQNDFSYNIARISFRIKNANAFPVKDLEVFCMFFGASGSPISSHTETIYEVVKSGATKRTPALSFGFTSEQTKKFNCSLTHFSRAD